MLNSNEFDLIKKRIRSENFPHNHTGIKYSGAITLNPPRSHKDVVHLRLIPAENNFLLIKYMEKKGTIDKALAESMATDTRFALEGELVDLGVSSARQLMERFERAVDRALERTLGSQER